MLTTGLTQEPAPNAPKGFGLWTVASALSATHSRAYSGAQQRRGGFVSNLLTLIRAAKSWGLGRTEKSKRGSKRSALTQRLPRKLQNTALVLISTHAVARIRSISQFSRQPLTAFGSHFEFLDRLNILENEA